MPLTALRRLKPFTTLILLHAIVVLAALILLVRQKGVPPPARETVVVIPIHGVISMERGSIGPSMPVSDIVSTINDLREKDEVKAIVLDINTPGGSVGATQAIYHALQKFRAKGKVIVSSFGDVAASGGYYIAVAGQKIVCHPGTITGSIGVLMQLPNVQGLLDKVGVRMSIIKTGDMKDAGSPFRALSERERDYFQKALTESYDQFITAVRTGRSLTAEELRPLADGRIFLGSMAVEQKLADRLGGLEDAIEEAKKLAGLDGKKPRIVHKRPAPSLERLLGMFGKSPIDGLADKVTSSAQILYLMQ